MNIIHITSFSIKATRAEDHQLKVIPSEARPTRRAEGQFLVGTNLLDQYSKTYLLSLIERLEQPNDYMFVYILASEIGVLYIGVTNALCRRMIEHRKKLNDGFTNLKNCTKLVYFELHHSPGEAIAREKQIKRWRREKKERLIKTLNPPWIDLVPWLPTSDEDHAH